MQIIVWVVKVIPGTVSEYCTVDDGFIIYTVRSSVVRATGGLVMPVIVNCMKGGV